jgi:hypothetical protein
MAHATRPLPGHADAPCSTLVDRVLVRIDGALGSTVFVGLDRLAVCRCDGPDGTIRPRRPSLPLADLRDARIVHVGSLPVLALHFRGRDEAQPVLILERNQIAAALDGLVLLRRLITAATAATAEAARPGPTAFDLPTQPRLVRVPR